MFFNTWTFALFALLAIAAFYVSRPAYRPYVLIFSGLLFYGSSGAGYLLLIVGVALATYVLGRAFEASPPPRLHRTLLVLGICGLVAVLVYYKYAHWLSEQLAEALPSVPIAIFGSPVVPLAISFFTFEFVHFLIEVSEGRIRRFKPVEFFTFALFFPTMLAGPIKRYRLFVPQLAKLRPARGADLQAAVYRIAVGFFKKLVIADPATAFVQPLIAPDPSIPVSLLLLAFVAGAVKFYFDLASYTDIAIGLATIFGLRVPENFARPFLASNIAEFWQRWHMSLTKWIRDYILVPLGRALRARAGSSPFWKRAAALLTVFTVMFAIGVWHGAAWHYWLWGAWNGACLVAYYLWRRLAIPHLPWLRRKSVALHACSIALTAASFVFGAALYICPTVGDAVVVYRRLLGV